MVYSVFLLIIILFSFKRVFALQRFYLEEECGGTIAMDEGRIPAGRLAVTRRSKYRSTFSCHVTILAPEQQRLVIVFREIDIELEPNCDDDFVQFFDGRTRSSPIIRGMKPRLCGHKPPIGNYVTTGNALTVYFQSDIYRQQNGFEIVFTAFHAGKVCGHNEFRCSNGRCIAKSLECDDYNNCGDDSDECHVDSETLVAIITSVFLLTIIATGVFLIIRRKKKKTKLQKAKDALSKALTFTYKFGGAGFARYDTQKENLPSSTDPADTQCQNDVVSASLRRNDVATTSTPCHFDDVCPVGDRKNMKEEGNAKPSGIELKENITETQAAVQVKDSIPKNGSRDGEGLKELNYQNKQLAEKEKGSWTRKSC